MGTQLEQVLHCYLLNSSQAVCIILPLQKNFWNLEQMPQLVHCDIKRVTKNQINTAFPFGILTVVAVCFPEVAHNQLSLTHFLCVFEKITAFSTA